MPTIDALPQRTAAAQAGTAVDARARTAPMSDSAQLLQLAHWALHKAGLDVAAIYRQFGGPDAIPPRGGMRTPHRLQAPFWRAVERVSGDPEIGLHLCAQLPPFHGGVLEYLVLNSRSLGEGYTRALKYLRLLSDGMALRLVDDASGARAVLRCGAFPAPQLRHTEICMLYGLIRYSQAITGSRRAPLRLQLRFPQRLAVPEYERVFGCPVEFDADESAIWFDRRLLGQRSPRWDPELLKLHENFAEKQLAVLRRQDLIERIRSVCTEQPERLQCKLHDIARALDLPARRLRFELLRAGTSFSQILAEFRYDLARQLLGSASGSIESIAYRTGFAVPATFSRAFKRWSGMTPAQFRAGQR